MVAWHSNSMGSQTRFSYHDIMVAWHGKSMGSQTRFSYHDIMVAWHGNSMGRQTRFSYHDIMVACHGKSMCRQARLSYHDVVVAWHCNSVPDTAGRQCMADAILKLGFLCKCPRGLDLVDLLSSERKVEKKCSQTGKTC